MRTSYKEGTVLKSDISRYELMLKRLEFGKTNVESAIEIMGGLATITDLLDASSIMIICLSFYGKKLRSV